MLLEKHIFHIQTILSSGRTSDDSRFSNRHIYFILVYLRAELLRQKANKSNYLNPKNFSTIGCFPLEKAPLEECGCYDVPCGDVLKGRYELPAILASRRGLLIKDVRTLGGIKLSQTSKETLEYTKYSRTKSKKPMYYIYNENLIVVNLPQLKVISISAVFEDPLELANISACNPDGEEFINPCYDPQLEDFPMDLDLTAAINKMTYEELVNIALRVPDDMANDAAPDKLQRTSK